MTIHSITAMLPVTATETITFPPATCTMQNTPAYIRRFPAIHFSAVHPGNLLDSPLYRRVSSMRRQILFLCLSSISRCLLSSARRWEA